MQYNLTGQHIGLLEVLGRAKGKKGGYWYVRCNGCGRILVKPTSQLRRRNYPQRCCWNCFKKRLGDMHRTHGETNTPLWNIWQSMRMRCLHQSENMRGYYLEDGIRVCGQWDESYEAFRDWALANGYKKGLTLDRINFKGDYDPGNCRFVGWKAQNRNKRNNHWLTINGKRKTIAEWAELSGVANYTICWRIKHGWPKERLLIPRTDSRGGNSQVWKTRKANVALSSRLQPPVERPE